MAALGFTPIQLYYSSTAAAVPTSGNLFSGELAINITDGKLYYKDNGGVVRLLADRTATTPVTTISFGTTGLTPSTATSGAVTVAGTLAIANGGTGQTTRQNAMDALAGAVTSGQYLRGNGTDVVMSAIQAADVPTLNQNTTGTASNVTGTVAIANGGTGATTAAAARTNLGASTLGANVFTLTNPSAITFPRFNADNTVSALTASAFRTAIGAGTSSTTGTVTSVALSGGTTGLTVTGSPITTSGTFTLTGTVTNATNATQITNSGGWNITPSGTTLFFNYNGTNVATLSSTGDLVVIGDVTAYGTL